MQLLRDLHEALVVACRRAAGSSKAQASEAASDGKENKKASRMDSSLRQLEAALAQRIAKLLLKSLRQVCRPASVSTVCSWHTADEWAGFARALATYASTAKNASIGHQSIEAGSLLLFFYCTAHNAVMKGGDNAWSLAEEVLNQGLRDWSLKKDSERWCQSMLTVFSGRVPHVLLRLPWVDQIRASGMRKTFVQRAQLSFVASHLLQGSALAVTDGGAAERAASFAELCAELLESTLKGDSDAKSSAEAGSNMAATQKQKLRREALRVMKVAIRTRKVKQGAAEDAVFPDKVTKRIAKVVTGVRDALPARHGEVYQTCLHVLRSVGDSANASDSPAAKRPRPSEEGNSKTNKRRKDSNGEPIAETPDVAMVAKKAKVQNPKSGPQVTKEKGNKSFFKEL